MAGQLVFPFGVEPALKLTDFIVAPSNEQAFAFVRRWPDWPLRVAALFGPKGSGKSHLAAIWREAAGAHGMRACDLVPELESGSFVIEDVDDGEPGEARDRALLGLFERTEGFLLLTGRAPPSQWPVAIKDLKSRFQSLIALAMWAPDDALLSALVMKHFADRQLAAPDSVVRRILTHVERTPEAVAAFIARADEKALAEKRAITERLVIELIETEEGGQNGRP
jgi:chromosomal replication initiation ATPase DnaA